MRAGKLDGEEGGWSVGEYSYCTCSITNVLPPEMSFKGKLGELEGEGGIPRSQ